MRKQNLKLSSKMIAILLLILFFTVFTFPTTVQADSSWWDKITGQAEGFIGPGEKESPIDLTNGTIVETVTGIANVLTTIGIIICTIGLAVIGIKYMIATPEEAAKLKTQLIRFCSCSCSNYRSIWYLVTCL